MKKHKKPSAYEGTLTRVVPKTTATLYSRLERAERERAHAQRNVVLPPMGGLSKVSTITPEKDALSRAFVTSHSPSSTVCLPPLISTTPTPKKAVPNNHVSPTSNLSGGVVKGRAHLCESPPRRTPAPKIGVEWDEVREMATKAMRYKQGHVTEEVETKGLNKQRDQAAALTTKRREDAEADMTAYEGSVHHKHHLEVRHRIVSRMTQQRHDEMQWASQMEEAERQAASYRCRREFQRNQRALVQAQRACMADLSTTLGEIEELRSGPCPLTSSGMDGYQRSRRSGSAAGSRSIMAAPSSSRLSSPHSPRPVNMFPNRSALRREDTAASATIQPSAGCELLSVGDRVKLCPLPVLRRLLQLSGLYATSGVVKTILKKAQGRISHIWGVLTVDWSSDDGPEESPPVASGLVSMRIEGAPEFLAEFIGETIYVPPTCISRLESSALGAPLVTSEDGRSFELGAVDISMEILGSLAYLTHTTMWVASRDMQKASATIGCVAHVPIPGGATLKEVAADLGSMGRLESVALPAEDGAQIFVQLKAERDAFNPRRASGAPNSSPILKQPPDSQISPNIHNESDAGETDDDALDLTNVGSRQAKGAVFEASRHIPLGKWVDAMGVGSSGLDSGEASSVRAGSEGAVLVPLHEVSTFHALRLKLVYCIRGTFSTPLEEGVPNPESMLRFEFPCSFPLRCLPSHAVRSFSSMCSFQCNVIGLSHRGARLQTCPHAVVLKSHSASGPRALFVGCRRVPGTVAESTLPPWINGRPIVVQYCPVRTNETQCMLWAETSTREERCDSVLCALIPPLLRIESSKDAPTSLGRQCFGRRVLLLIDASLFRKNVSRSSPAVQTLQRDVEQYVSTLIHKLSPGDGICWCVADLKSGTYFIGQPLAGETSVSSHSNTATPNNFAGSGFARGKLLWASSSLEHKESSPNLLSSNSFSMKQRSSQVQFVGAQVFLAEVPTEGRVLWASSVAREVASCLSDADAHTDRCGAVRKDMDLVDFFKWGQMNCFRTQDRSVGITAKGEVVKEVHMVLFSSLPESVQSDLAKYLCEDGQGVRLHSILTAPPNGATPFTVGCSDQCEPRHELPTDTNATKGAVLPETILPATSKASLGSSASMSLSGCFHKADPSSVALFGRTALLLMGLADRLRSVHTTVHTSALFAHHAEHLLAQVSFPMGVGIDLHFSGSSKVATHGGLSTIAAGAFLFTALTVYYPTNAPTDSVQLTVRQTYNNRLIKKFPCPRTSIPLSTLTAPTVLPELLAAEGLAVALLPTAATTMPPVAALRVYLRAALQTQTVVSLYGISHTPLIEDTRLSRPDTLAGSFSSTTQAAAAVGPLLRRRPQLYLYHSSTNRVGGNEIGSTHFQGSGLLPLHISRQLYPSGDGDAPEGAAAAGAPAGGVTQLAMWQRLCEKTDGGSEDDVTHIDPLVTPITPTFLSLPASELFRLGCFTAVDVGGTSVDVGERGAPRLSFSEWSLQLARDNADNYNNLLDEEFTARPAIEGVAWEEHLDLKAQEQRALAELLIARAGLLRRLRIVEEGHRVSSEAVVQEEREAWAVVLDRTMDARLMLHRMNLAGAEERRRLAYTEEDARYAIIDDQRRVATVAAIVLCRGRPTELSRPLTDLYPHVTPGLRANDSAAAVQFVLVCIDRFHNNMRIIAFLKCASALLCEVDSNTSWLLGMDGGVARCVDMINKYIAQEEVVGSVLITVAHIASIRACHNRLVRSGILFDVLRALKQHELSEELQVNGLRAVVTLAKLSPVQFAASPLGLVQLFKVLPSAIGNREYVHRCFQVVEAVVKRAPECRLAVAEVGMPILHTALVAAHGLPPSLARTYFSICAILASNRPAMCVLASSRQPVVAAVAVLEGNSSPSLKLHVLDALKALCGNVADGPAAVMGGVLVPMARRCIPREPDLGVAEALRALHSRLTLNENMVEPIAGLPPALHPLFLPRDSLHLLPIVASRRSSQTPCDPDLERMTPLRESRRVVLPTPASFFHGAIEGRYELFAAWFDCRSGAPTRHLDAIGFLAPVAGNSNAAAITDEAIAATMFIEVAERSSRIALPTVPRCIGFACHVVPGLGKEFVMAIEPSRVGLVSLRTVLREAKDAAERASGTQLRSSVVDGGTLRVCPISIIRFLELAIALFEVVVAMQHCSVVHGNINLDGISVPPQAGHLWSLPSQNLSVTSRAKATLRRAVSKYVSLLSMVNAGKLRRKEASSSLPPKQATNVVEGNSMLAAIGMKASPSQEGVNDAANPPPVDESSLRLAISLIEPLHGARSPLARPEVPFLHDCARVGFVDTQSCLLVDTPLEARPEEGHPTLLLPCMSPMTESTIADCTALWEAAHSPSQPLEAIARAPASTDADDVSVRQVLLEVLNYGEPVDGFGMYVQDRVDEESAPSSPNSSTTSGVSASVISTQKEQLFVLLRKLPRELGDVLFSKVHERTDGASVFKHPPHHVLRTLRAFQRTHVQPLAAISSSTFTSPH